MLEVLQILEAEVNLREATRVAEQARSALERDDYMVRAVELADTQDGLRERVDNVVARIIELPAAAASFEKELQLLSAVSEVMTEATDILSQPETGKPAVAAETEAIELLLQSKRINPKGGGGSGLTPGGGGGGTTTDSALALVGSGSNDKEVRETRGVSQATGEFGREFPEEFKSGLDEFFNRLDKDYRRQ